MFRVLPTVVLATAILLGSLLSFPVAGAPDDSSPPPAHPMTGVGHPRLDAASILRHTRELSSDAFEGRAPGTKGEELTVAYLARQFEQIGLVPAGIDGTWFQPVPLLGITGIPTPLTVRSGALRLDLRPRDDFVAFSKRAADVARVADSEMVFVGYGIEAPEFGWDDFKGVDLAGKTMVVMVGDPPVPDPSDPSRLDPKMFGGSAMTWYGRWTCKYEMAARKGAAGVLIVHETAAAGYPFSVVQGNLREQFDLVTPDGNAGRAAVEGWLTLDAARRIFSAASKDFDRLKARAATRSFAPVPLGLRASVEVRNTMRTVQSRNVVGLLPGRDARRRGEIVAVTAHWDHLGVGPAVNGDPIYHGARDNAVAVGGLLELARAFSALPPDHRPLRSLLFLCPTAEEQGMLGSEHYVRHPLFPLEKTLAVLNLEVPNVYGRTRDLVVVGLGTSDLDIPLSEAATGQGRFLSPDPHAEQGWYYRSDHFPFARAGVPAVWAGGGSQYVGRPDGYGAKVHAAYVRTRYHKPGDQVTPDWDLRGAVEDLAVYFSTALAVANGDDYPRWNADAEFRKVREEMLRRKR